MEESERLQRYRNENMDYADEKDSKLAERILKLLNHPKLDKYCMVDAYYYDFSVIPCDIQEKNQLWHDVYLIFGITTEGEMITKWIERWNLDSSDEIVDGVVIKSDRKIDCYIPPEIMIFFNKDLLSTSIPNIESNR